MPGYARDTRKPKRKQVAEPKAAMAQRLADDSRSIWTLVECERMTQEELMNRLRDLGLPGRLSRTSNAGQSWEELKAAKVASDEKAAAAKKVKKAAATELKEKAAEKKAAAKAEKAAAAAAGMQLDDEGQVVPFKQTTTYMTADGVAKVSAYGEYDWADEHLVAARRQTFPVVCEGMGDNEVLGGNIDNVPRSE